MPDSVQSEFKKILLEPRLLQRTDWSGSWVLHDGALDPAQSCDL